MMSTEITQDQIIAVLRWRQCTAVVSAKKYRKLRTQRNDETYQTRAMLCDQEVADLDAMIAPDDRALCPVAENADQRARWRKLYWWAVYHEQWTRGIISEDRFRQKVEELKLARDSIA